jgi:hypothetical protein
MWNGTLYLRAKSALRPTGAPDHGEDVLRAVGTAVGSVLFRFTPWVSTRHAAPPEAGTTLKGGGGVLHLSSAYIHHNRLFHAYQ